MALLEQGGRGVWELGSSMVGLGVCRHPRWKNSQEEKVPVPLTHQSMLIPATGP